MFWSEALTGALDEFAMLIGRFIKQLVVAAVAVALVAANPRAGTSPNLWAYSCTAKLGLMWEDGQLKELNQFFCEVCW